MCKDTQVAEKTQQQQQQRCWRQPEFAGPSSPNYINTDNIMKVIDISFAREMSADNCISSSKCNFCVLFE